MQNMQKSVKLRQCRTLNKCRKPRKCRKPTKCRKPGKGRKPQTLSNAENLKPFSETNI